jgi:hypothetical protein
MVMFGHSYRFVRMSRAVDAHSSPRRKFGFVLSFGWFEKRAAIAHTESISTGGSVPALRVKLLVTEDKYDATRE